MIRPWRRKARVDGASDLSAHGKVRVVKHDLGTFELRADGRTVNATADGRAFGATTSLKKGVVRLRPPVPLRLQQ